MFEAPLKRLIGHDFGVGNRVEVRVLGPSSVSVDGQPVDLGGPRQRRLLAALVLDAGEVVGADRLIERVWTNGDLPADPRRTLRTYLTRLRRAMGGDSVIVTDSSGWRIDEEVAQVDVRHFDRLVAGADEPGLDVHDRLARLDSALGLWRGTAYEDVSGDDWARAEIDRLDELRLTTKERRYEAMLAAGMHTDVLPGLAGEVEISPLRSRMVGLQMLALHRAGRQAEATRAFQAHRHHLDEELGLEPGSDLVELDRRILADDPSLRLSGVAGRSLRGYRLGEQLGEGAFAVVYRGTQPSVGRDVAVKIIRPELANRPDFVRRFEAEAHLVAHLEHPYIVPLYDYWREPDRACLVFRYLRGGTLESTLTSTGGLGLDEAQRMVEQVGSALAAAHASGVVHRDVKPANVFLDEVGNFYLGDFGIALEATDVADPAATLSAGSPAYASPEQLRREAVGPPADVHGLGIAVYEALTARLPFPEAVTEAQLLQRQLNDPIPAVRELRNDVPAAVDVVLARATRKEAGERFQTVDEFIAEFSIAMEVDSHHALARIGTATTVSVGEDRNPYKGLRAFTEADAADFHGREHLTQRLVEMLGRSNTLGRIAAVVGPSGIGKSSIVRAGLLPALRGGALLAADRWFVATMLPGSDPFEELGTALMRVATRVPDNMMGQLTADRRGITRVVKSLVPEDDDTQVLLVIDQFEELFTLVEDTTVQRRFLDAIEHAITDARCPLRVVFTMRADFWDRPLRHGSFARLIEHSTVHVTALAPDELERAITEPAHRSGCEFEPGLVSEIVADVTDQPGALPLLQYALTELWEHRISGLLTRDAYRELGGVTGALTRRAEDLFQEAAVEEQDTIRRIFGRLVSLGEGTEDTRRRALRGEFVSNPGADAIIDRFGQARLLSFDRDPGTREPTLEVAHEALIRQWPRLRQWLDEDRDGLRIMRHLNTSARDWDNTGRPDSELYRGGRLEAAEEWAGGSDDGLAEVEARFLATSVAIRSVEQEAQRSSHRRLRRLLSGVAVVAVIALLATVVALQQRSRANDSAEMTQLALSATETRRLSSEAGQLGTTSRELGLLVAVEAHRREVSPETLGALQRALVNNGEFLALRGAGNSYRRVHWSSDGTAIYAMREGAIDLLALDGSPRAVVYDGSTAEDFAVSPDGRVLAVASRTDDVRLINAVDGTRVGELAHAAQVTSIAFTPDGRYLLTGDRAGWLRVWDFDGQSLAGEVHAHPEEIWPTEAARHEALLFPVGVERAIASPDGTDIFTSGGFFVRRFRLTDLTLVDEWSISRSAVTGGDPIPGTPGDLAFSGDGKRLFAAVQRVVQVIDLANGELIEEFQPGVNPGTVPRNFDLALGEQLVVLTHQGGLHRFDPTTFEAQGELIDVEAIGATLEGHDLAISPDRRLVATGSFDGVRIFALDGSTAISRGVRAENLATGAQVSSDGRFVMTIDQRSAPLIYDLDQDVLQATEVAVPDSFWAHLDQVDEPVAWQRYGEQSMGFFIDLETGQPTGRRIGPLTIANASTSPDGTMVAVGSIQPAPVQVAIYDLDRLGAHPQLLTPPVGRGGVSVWDIAWSHDQERLLVLYNLGLAIVYETETWTEIEPYLSDGGIEITAAAFSPDGRTLVTGDHRGRITVRDATTFQPTGDAVIAGSGGLGAGNFRALEFTPDGDYLVSALSEPLLIDAATWTTVGDAFPSEPGFGLSVPRGALFVPAMTDGNVQVWTLDPKSWSTTACAAAGRNLTRTEWQQFGPGDEPYQATCPQWTIEQPSNDQGADQ